MMRQCRFIHCSKCVILVETLIKAEAVMRWGQGEMWKISVPSQFCCFPKTSLKQIKSFLKTGETYGYIQTNVDIYIVKKKKSESGTETS